MNETQLTAFFEDLHRHPELSMRETRTAERVRGALRAAGVELLPCGLPTGIIAVVRGAKPGRVIGLRADMDALPIAEESGLPYASETHGVMHACGHDFHTSCVLGAALLLAERRDALSGTVKIVFQPGEETSDGGRIMAREPAIADVEEFYAGHTYPAFPAGTLGLKPGPVMAAPDAFTLTIRGKGTHAGNPHFGIDPIPAAAALILSAQTLITRGKDAFEPAVLSFAHVEAGSTWNIIPEEVRVEGTLRTLDEELRQTLRRRLGEMADLTARAHGCTASIRWDIGPGPVMNDPALCGYAEALAREMGFTVAPQANTMGGEDFSEYLRDIPGLFVRVGTGGGYTNHHPKFAVDEKALWPAARFFAELAQRRAGMGET